MSKRLAVVLAIVLGAIAFLVVQGLGNATTFFRNVDEALEERDDLGTRRFRLQGIVLPGTIDKTGDGLDFTVEWNCKTIDVRHDGAGHALLKDGIPVVLEGAFERGSNDYDSDRVIIKHTEEYRTEESEDAEKSYEDRCGS
jgi:cytochrome c-type biogenesis protein CcmE